MFLSRIFTCMFIFVSSVSTFANSPMEQEEDKAAYSCETSKGGNSELVIAHAQTEEEAREKAMDECSANSGFYAMVIIKECAENMKCYEN